jgi:heterodisulfide reductase subunit C
VICTDCTGSCEFKYQLPYDPRSADDLTVA